MHKQLSILLAVYLAMTGWAAATETMPPRPAQPDPRNATLMVTGKIAQPTPVRMDLEALMQMDASVFELTDRRTGRKDRYKGVAFIDFLNFMGMDASATQVEVVAANNYKATIRVDDLRRYNYLLTYAVNGQLYKELPPQQNKGPVAIAIDFDKHPELDWDIYKHQLVWFVKTIEVR